MTIMWFKKMNKKFKSAIDQYMQQFDNDNAPTRSQRKEIDKHQSISKRRDNSIPPTSKQKNIEWPED